MVTVYFKCAFSDRWGWGKQFRARIIKMQNWMNLARFMPSLVYIFVVFFFVRSRKHIDQELCFCFRWVKNARNRINFHYRLVRKSFTYHSQNARQVDFRLCEQTMLGSVRRWNAKYSECFHYVVVPHESNSFAPRSQKFEFSLCFNVFSLHILKVL